MFNAAITESKPIKAIRPTDVNSGTCAGGSTFTSAVAESLTLYPVGDVPVTLTMLVSMPEKPDSMCVARVIIEEARGSSRPILFHVIMFSITLLGLGEVPAST